MIDRETEATLAVIGCSPLLDAKGRGAILFDIGGGSTELVRIERDPAGQNAPPRIKAWMSIPLGVVTLAEHFGGRDVTPKSYARMVREVAQYVAPFAAEHGGDLRDMHLLGTSGTVTNSLTAWSTALNNVSEGPGWRSAARQDSKVVMERLLGQGAVRAGCVRAGRPRVSAGAPG